MPIGSSVVVARIERPDSLDLPVATPITRGTKAFRRNRIVGALLVLVGLALTGGPIVGGLFGDVAAGQQMLDDFEPRLQADALAGYHSDVALLRDAGTGLDEIYRAQHIAPGRFGAIDDYREQSPAIADRADDLLARISAGVPDYQRLAGVGGFERIPFVLVLVGVTTLAAGVAVLAGRRPTITRAIPIAVIGGLVLIILPVASGLGSAASSGGRMLSTLAPVMNHEQVRQLQDDFVVVVSAVGVLDTDFRAVPHVGPGTAQVAALQQNWSKVSGDLADLVGAVNDNIDNYQALAQLDDAPFGVSGFAALPWLLVGIGAVTVIAALTAWPTRTRSETGSRT